MTWSKTKLRDFFRYFDENNPNHLTAADMLQKAAPQLMSDQASWVKMYRTPNLESKDNKENIAVEEASDIIKEFEGFIADPYLCPAGVWTIGYGTTYYPNGKLVQVGDPNITESQASELLSYYIQHNILPVLSKEIPTWGQMTAHQQAAIISFAYNLGTHFYNSNGFSTISRALSSVSNFGDVPSALMLYVNPGTNFEAGLRRRRAAEGELWEGKGPFTHG